jgi:hypothetical protein
MNLPNFPDDQPQAKRAALRAISTLHTTSSDALTNCGEQSEALIPPYENFLQKSLPDP